MEEIWKKGDDWCFLKEHEKYNFSAKGIKENVRAAIESTETDVETKKLLIADNIKETISRPSENHDIIDNLVAG